MITASNTFKANTSHGFVKQTMSLKFIDGKLHQLFIVECNGEIISKEWHLVPSEVSHD
jgi:hypothetical protein